MKPLTHEVTEKLNLVSFLAALCLFLGAIEYMLPKPVPFLRLGLANLPILLALSLLNTPYLLLLILLKVLAQALIQGTLFSYTLLLSFSGSFASGLVMLAAHRLFGRAITLVGISIFGAMASNLCQLFLAVYLIFGKSGWMIAPVLLGIGLASSTLLGLFAEAFNRISRWIKERLSS